MPFVVSQEFKDAQAKRDFKPVRRIYYKRRTVTGGGETFEGTWTQVPDNEVVKFGTVSRSFDKQSLNEVQSSNITIVLKNINHKWREGSAESVFNPSFIAFKTKFQIRTGYKFKKQNAWTWGSIGISWGDSGSFWGGVQDPGGIEEVIEFTGFLVALREDHSEGTVAIQMEGPERLLRETDAETVSLPVSENFAGDGIQVQFITAAVGVGRITSVKVDAVSQVLGSDFNLSDLNTKTQGAKITFVVPPPDLSTITVEGIRWKQNRRIDDLVKDLLTEAGITDHSGVEPVVFEEDVQNQKIIDSSGDWALQTPILDGNGASTVDIAAVPGSVQAADFPPVFEDFTDDFSTGVPTWTLSGEGTPKLSSTGNKFQHDHGDSGFHDSKLSTPSTQASGTWEFNLENHMLVFPAGTNEIEFFDTSDNTDTRVYFMMNGSDPDTASGYCARFLVDYTGSFLETARIFRIDSGTLVPISKEFIVSLPSDRVHKVVFRITRSSAGVFEVAFWDDDHSGSAGNHLTTAFEPGGPTNPPKNTDFFTDTTYNTSTHIILRYKNFVNVTFPNQRYLVSQCNYIRRSTQFKQDFTFSYGRFTPLGQIQSEVVDLGASLTTIGVIDRLESATSPADPVGPNANPIRYFTETSNVLSPFNDPDGPLEINTVTGQVQSSVRRFLRLRIDLRSSQRLIQSPRVDKVTFNWLTSSTEISLANFTNQEAFTAIQELGRLADYEWGFDPDERFFFRRRAVIASPSFTFTQGVEIIAINNARLSYDRIFNQVRASFGIYDVEISPITQAESIPNSFTRYGKNKLEVSAGQLLTNESANVARNIARAKFSNFKEPRFQILVDLKMFPQANLADVVDAVLDELSAAGQWSWGEAGQFWGKTDIFWGGSKLRSNVTKRMKIVSLNKRLDDFVMSAEMEEV